jgi:DNA-binding transcriptional regulator LsrR (DeoR family)
MDTTATESSGPPRRKQVRGAERQELMQRAAKLYKAKGGTVRSVATEIGMSYGGAHRLLKDAVRARLLDGMKSRGTR